DIDLADYNFYSADAQFNYAGANHTFATWQMLGFDAHSLTGDPLFKDAANGDYALLTSPTPSPAIDAVNAAALGAGNVPSADFNGQPRPAGAAPDMGAFESFGMVAGVNHPPVVNSVTANPTTAFVGQ